MHKRNKSSRDSDCFDVEITKQMDITNEKKKKKKMSSRHVLSKIKMNQSENKFPL